MIAEASCHQRAMSLRQPPHAGGMDGILLRGTGNGAETFALVSGKMRVDFAFKSCRVGGLHPAAANLNMWLQDISYYEDLLRFQHVLW